jgi:thymidylate synthase ThyX
MKPIVKLIAITQGAGELEGKSAQEVITYNARVSNPKNQDKFDTSAGLLRYCINHNHWSIFEQADMTVEINTTRGIAAQILRHKSFFFLEDAVGLKLINKTAVISNNVFIGCNGIPLHQDYEWLKDAKEKSILNSTGVLGIAEEADVSYHTIRKWLKIHNICFTKKETAKCFPVWNKGVYGYINPPHSEETKEKMRQKARRGEHSNLWRGGTSGERKQIQADITKYRKSLMEDYNFSCGICEKRLDGKTHLHHIIPSQRYADVSLLQHNAVAPDLRSQDTKNRQNSIDNIPLYKKLKMQGEIQEHFARGQNLYKRLVDDGIALECARFVLPLATPTRMYMKGSCRSWIHYIGLRTHEATQKEHRDVADAVKCIFICQFPDVAAALHWERTPECPECNYQPSITLE